MKLHYPVFTRGFLVLLHAFLYILFSPSAAMANELVPLNGTFLVKPAKLEISLAPGESKEIYISLANGTNMPLHVDVSFEDFGPASQNKPSDDPIVLLKETQGQKTLRDNLKTTMQTLNLLSQESAHVPIDISLPKDAEPGGRYGSVVFTFAPIAKNNENAANISVSSRIASLLFVRVKGDAREEGALAAFGLFNNAKMVRSPSADDPLRFQVAYENKGNVHLNPYGRILINSITGKPIAFPVDPYVVLPKATRMLEVDFVTPLSPGFYTAHLDFNRGYGDVIETREVNFVVFPGPWGIFFSLIGIVIFVFVIKRSLRLSRNFVSSQS